MSDWETIDFETAANEWETSEVRLREDTLVRHLEICNLKSLLLMSPCLCV